jgi:hypothetical protein
MQWNLYWPLNGPSFSPGAETPSLYFSLVEGNRRRLRVKFRGTDGKPTDAQVGDRRRISGVTLKLT